MPWPASGLPVRRSSRGRRRRGTGGLHADIASRRDQLPFDIDGVVYKGRRPGAPGTAGIRQPGAALGRGHKYPAQEQMTLLRDIDIQVGRTGKLTPVAKLEPVFVGGVTGDQRHPCTTRTRRGARMRLGDTVIVRRAGDVIPEVVGVVSNAVPIPQARCSTCGKRQGNVRCQSAIVREEGEVDWRCSGGLFCGRSAKQAILHFAQRRAMDIEAWVTRWSSSWSTACCKACLACLPSRPGSWPRWDRMGDKSAIKLVKAIQGQP